MTLQDSVQFLQSQTTWENEFLEEPLDPQPLAESIWEYTMPENLKPPHLPSFDGKIDPQEHIIVVNNQKAIIGASNSPKCKLMVGTFKNVALHWNLNFTRTSVLRYSDLAKKMVQHFSTNKHRKVSTTSLFNV